MSACDALMSLCVVHVMLIINLKNVIIEYHCATIEVLQSRGGQILMNFITFLVHVIVKLNHCPVGGCS